MKDVLGNELSIDDNVIFCKSEGTSVCNLHKGTITGFCNRSGYECAHIIYNQTFNEGTEYAHVIGMDITLSSKKVVKL